MHYSFIQSETFPHAVRLPTIPTITAHHHSSWIRAAGTTYSKINRFLEHFKLIRCFNNIWLSRKALNVSCCFSLLRSPPLCRVLLCVVQHIGDTALFSYFCLHIWLPLRSIIYNEPATWVSISHSPPAAAIVPSNRAMQLNPLLNFPYSKLRKCLLRSPFKLETHQATTSYKLYTQTILTLTSSRVSSNMKITAKTWLRTWTWKT